MHLAEAPTWMQDNYVGLGVRAHEPSMALSMTYVCNSLRSPPGCMTIILSVHMHYGLKSHHGVRLDLPTMGLKIENKMPK